MIKLKQLFGGDTTIFVPGCFGYIIVTSTSSYRASIEHVSMKVFSIVSVMSTKTNYL